MPNSIGNIPIKMNVMDVNNMITITTRGAEKLIAEKRETAL